MRIGVDARLLSSDTPTGIGVCIIEALHRMSEYEDENEYYLFSNKPIPGKFKYRKNFHLIVIPSKSGSLWVYTHLSRHISSYGIDAFWAPAHLLPIGHKSMRKVLTINDIALMINPKWGNWQNAIIQNTLVRMSIKHADKIISISNHTKEDLIRIVKTSENKIRVVYPGLVLDSLVMQDGVQEVTIRDNIRVLLNKKYILYVGTLEPRKNVVNIVKAFNRLKENHPEYDLILAGKVGWNAQNIQKEISNSLYRESIFDIGYVTNQEKTALLKNAVLFVFPSCYEGFGIPVAEAIAAGLPVVTSRNSSLIEVAGPEQFYVENAEDDGEIYQQMNRVISTSAQELKLKNSISQKHIQQFTWEAYAKGIFLALMNK